MLTIILTFIILTSVLQAVSCEKENEWKDPYLENGDLISEEE